MTDKEFKGCGCQSVCVKPEVSAIEDSYCIAPALAEALEAIIEEMRYYPANCDIDGKRAIDILYRNAKSALAQAYGVKPPA